jgi:ribose 5-phosphate isomerase B
MLFKKILLGSDHAGFRLKDVLIKTIHENGWIYEDCGPFQEHVPVDYPDFAASVAQAVQKGERFCGVLICSSGLGMSMAANRFPGIRAALCHETLSAQLARQHNDANILVLGEGLIGPKMARACLMEFIMTGFEEGRHSGRLKKLELLTK